jgi:lipid II:glycine glycyltransferase (peptidoglycan interpeptide bridge formation enzyme)
MAKKSPEQRLQELQEQQEKLERELKQRRARIVRQKKQQQAKLMNQQRKADTRRKVLIGAAILARVQSGEMRDDQLTAMMDNYLERDDDRALFDLPPSGSSEATNEPASQATLPDNS